MNTLYLFQSSTLLFLLLSIYFIFLRKTKVFQFNRAYLLSALSLSLIYPLLQIEINTFDINNIINDFQPWHDVNGSTKAFIQTNTSSLNTSKFTITNFIKVIYWIGVMLFAIRFIANLIRLLVMSRKGIASRDKLIIVPTNKNIQPFSFFNYLYVSKNHLEESLANKALIKHEKAHSKQLHSIDLVYTELILCMFWFNPIIWLYIRFIKQNHEYLADEYAYKKLEFQPYYLNSIVNAHLRSIQLRFTSSFSYPQLKSRITMLKKKENTFVKNTLRITTVVVLSTSLFALSSFKTNSPLYQLTEISIPENVPSISPIKKEQIVRIASGYGMRVHPIYKVSKMHTGIDLIAVEGTPILATAAGKVILSEYNKSWGHHIIIEHGPTYQTHYSHMSTRDKKVGDVINLRDKIGLIGSTGKSVSIHLHYEVIKKGEKVNPSDFFELE